MKKDDPKVAILLQQADLLCSLATKIKTDDTSQSMDEAWQVWLVATSTLLFLTYRLNVLGTLLLNNCCMPDFCFQQLQHHLVKKEDDGVSENSGSGMASLLEELDDLIVDPYESKEEG